MALIRIYRETPPTLHYPFRDGAVILYRKLTAAGQEAIAAKYRKVDYKAGARHEFIPGVRFLDHFGDLVDAVIVGWEGEFVDEHDRPVPPTRETKLAFVDNYPDAWADLWRRATGDLDPAAIGTAAEGHSPNS